MAFDEGLAERLRAIYADHADAAIINEKRMFGGLAFMVNGHMSCGIVGDMLMARVGADRYEQALLQPHAREMDFTGRSMKGLVYVSPEGFESDDALADWVRLSMDFVLSLPPK